MNRDACLVKEQITFCQVGDILVLKLNSSRKQEASPCWIDCMSIFPCLECGFWSMSM